MVGASGALGREVVALLQARGFDVRALGRSPARLAALGADEAWAADLTDAAALRGCCAGVEAVISCAGASMALGGFRDRRSFEEVDAAGNRKLLAEAERAGVGRLVYVSLFGASGLLVTEYARAHERFVAALRASEVPHVVVRPTGFFRTVGELVGMVRRGVGVVVGPGEARTNHVHEADVALACVEALSGEAGEVAIGGPEAFTRRELVELAFAAVSKRPRIVHVPPAVLRAGASLARLVQPRLGGLLHFGVEVSLVDVVAPAVGTHRLEPYLRALARERI